MTRRTLRKDLDAFQEVYNAAWRKNWGFVPYSKEDLDAYALDLQLVFDPDWFMVAETPDGEVAGVAISPLDVNQALKQMNGRLLPLGWWHFLRPRAVHRPRPRRLPRRPPRAPAHRRRGVAVRRALRHGREGPRLPRRARLDPRGQPDQPGMEALGGTVIRKLRVYRRDLTELGRGPLGCGRWSRRRSRRHGRGRRQRAAGHRARQARRPGRDAGRRGRRDDVRRRRGPRRRPARPPRPRRILRPRRRRQDLPILATRSFLVDVHLLDPRR